MVNECVMYSCVFLSCLELVFFGVLFVLNGNLLTKKESFKSQHQWLHMCGS